ncbi:MAG: holo-ACP synthase [Chloroflexi bacterium]|nr:holo-ACP synthase [Chloroflexota bacterium]
MIAIDRVERIVSRFGARFLERVFTEEEVRSSFNRADKLAARLAAKEAASKALGCGIGRVGWRDLEVRVLASGQPELIFHGHARELASELDLAGWSVSLSHDRDANVAVATVVAWSA